MNTLTDLYYVKTANILMMKNGFVKSDDYNRTSIKNVYAGGDIVGEEATVAYAARSGRETANYITQILQKNNTSVI